MLKKAHEETGKTEKKPYSNLSKEQLAQLNQATQAIVVPESGLLVAEVMTLLSDLSFREFLGKDTAKALEIIITPSDVLGEWREIEWYALRKFLQNNKNCLQNSSLTENIDPLVLKNILKAVKARIAKAGLDFFDDGTLIADLKKIVFFQDYPDHQPYSEMIINEAIAKGLLITTDRKPGEKWFLFPSEKFFQKAKAWLKNNSK